MPSRFPATAQTLRQSDRSDHPADEDACHQAETEFARANSFSVFTGFASGQDTLASIAIADNRTQRANFTGMSSKRRIIRELHRELNWGNQGWGWHIPEGVLRHTAHVHHKRNPAAGPHIHRDAAAGHTRQGIAHRM